MRERHFLIYLAGMNKGVKKKVTIDTLAVMVAKGFEATKDDLKELEKKLTGEVDSVKKEVEGVKNQLEGTNKRIDALAETKVSKTTYKELENRVDVVEKKL